MKTPQIAALPDMSPLGLPVAKTARHTPGPWHYDGYIVTADAGNPNQAVARVTQFLPEFREESAANAALIVSAPDLLAALRLLLDGLQTYAPEFLHGLPKADYIRAARAAIAKAEGR